MTDEPAFGTVLRQILEQYPSPKYVGKGREYKTVNTDEALHNLVTVTARSATESALSNREESFHIRPSMGQGDMSDIPYIPVQISRETETTQKGIYVVYLFDTDAQRLYLSLNQGATEAQRAAGLAGPPYSTEILTRHAASYRSLVECPDRFTDGSTQLTETVTVDGEEEAVNRAEKYNAGSIVYREYDLDELGEDATDTLIQDLDALLDVYEELLDILYAVPEFKDDDATVWKISPEGGDDPYWATWQTEGIASIGYSKEATFKEDEQVDSPPEPHNSPERMAYNIQKEITAGDIVVAGAPKTKIDVAFGVGRVTEGHYDTMAEIDDPSEVGPADFDHDLFISVDWHAFADDGVAVNCLKDGKKLFHNWTVETFNARLDHFVGAVARRMAVQELVDNEETLIDQVVTHLDLERIDTGRPLQTTTPENETKQNLETYADWWAQHEDAIASAEGLESPEHLIFPDGVDTEIISRIASALANGKHVILTGPPGTGKTKLARHAAEHYIGNAYEMVTATADWSTFDTIGGFRPRSDRQLQFHSGMFLDRFQATESGIPQTEWLIIDELNRADIDKAFGSLLSALTGETIRLPFEVDDEPITLIGDPAPDDARAVASHRYFIPSDWRLIGTMNTYDKTSLYQLSYAFMRRFAFIPVSVPDATSIDDDLIKAYAAAWFDDVLIDDSTAEHVAALWTHINEVRPIGPAIVRDIWAEVRTDTVIDFTDALIMYVMPQLEGLSKAEQREFVAEIQQFTKQTENSVTIDIEALEDFVFEYFNVEVSVSSS
ncbi:5-methylcytosine-specific restriction endonuclease McrBC, GTP-binding regulatory subunit McrB [Halogranum amylolyticum]|uniref:5-methylcytosine-specific restriction endonuclease McrBC, GTP-binding regulatory subunit McrB n=1 Tax=Halogranum amylolyticum TaxID=660520 RepID=A0A1H8VPV2_9EURY|nr:DUF3578 domain-containing protein [Halogranum amylolyticum]SEP17330.1 5-methylcytosine-specific restriction endonuclease McrBC, GTP-binding regulatory subunit McrB [Halogranum amylolyticum]